MQKIVEDAPPKLDVPHTPHLGDFLMRCVQKDARRRPAASQLLRHPWITADRLPIPQNALVPPTLPLSELFDVVKVDAESESESEDDTSECETEIPQTATSHLDSSAIEEEEEEEEEEDELDDAQREIRNFNKEFDELILWLKRALDQHNNKQARRLCEVIEKRDKPLRSKYGTHPDAQGLIEALNNVLSRYYKVWLCRTRRGCWGGDVVRRGYCSFNCIFVFSPQNNPTHKYINFLTPLPYRKWRVLWVRSNSKLKRMKRRKKNPQKEVKKKVRMKMMKGSREWT
jgi:hypothetical protein